MSRNTDAASAIDAGGCVGVRMIAADNMFVRDRRSTLAGRSPPCTFVRTREMTASIAPLAGVVMDHKSALSEPARPVAMRLN